MSAIEWTDRTWNPIAGCRRVSPGCLHCYAIREARRKDASNPAYQGAGISKYFGTTERRDGRIDWTGRYNFDPAALSIPSRVHQPTIWFVNSMSDLFGEGVTDDQIVAIFAVMKSTPHHTYQILTKRPHRAARMAAALDWTPNIWMGTSIELDKYVNRAKELAKVPAALRFISAEPLLGDLPSLDLNGIGWVIAGGESGPETTIRPMDPVWARALRDRCRAAGVPYFFKQWGAFGEDGIRRPKADNGHLLDGEELFEMPAVVSRALAAKPKTTTINLRRPSAAPAPTQPVPLPQGVPPRMAFRDIIMRRLQSGAMEAKALRAANGALAKPASNQHAWALVDLQREGRVHKRPDGKYGIRLKLKASL